MNPLIRRAACVSLISFLAALAAPATAQPISILHAFAGGGDGASPWAGLVRSQNTLYGTVFSGGIYVEGTVFSVNADGSGFTNIYHFTGGADGANPYGTLILSGDTLYGTTSYGGELGSGTVFKLKTDGSGFVTLHGFSGASDGGKPWAGLVLSSTTLYGTTQIGGKSGNGTVFALQSDGSGFTNVYEFGGTQDGATPYAGLVLFGDTLYGAAHNGGSAGNGTLFAVRTDGTGFTNLHNFTATTGAALVNDDGAGPWGALLLSGSTLFGTASAGGTAGNGTIFSLTTNGTDFTVLHTFSPTSGATLSNPDGAFPVAPMLLLNDTLYGTAQTGGASGSGNVFGIRTNGSDFKPLYSFAASPSQNAPNVDGAYPVSGLLLLQNVLYGTAYSGGTSGYGSVFGLALAATAAPALTIEPSVGAVILSWPANTTGFTLQSTTNLASPVWATVPVQPSVVNGRNTVTNSSSGLGQFFRLGQ